MSHDYTKHSKPQETPVTPDEINTVEDPVVAPVTPDPTADLGPEPKDDTDEIIGVVTECVKLNVRKEPAADAEILTTIPLGAEVQIDVFESTEDFYKVCTGAGVEGYCVKDYINID